MTLWLVILGSAVGGGLLLIHGFGKAKATNDGMLEAYRDMLHEYRVRQEKRKEEEKSAATDSEQPGVDDTPAES